VSDPCDRPARPSLALALLAALAACQPLDPPELPGVPGIGATPCTSATATRADTVVVTLGICNPSCIEVPAGTAVTFLNQDPVQYQFAVSGAGGFVTVVPAWSAGETPPLSAGTIEVSAIESPATAVTILVDEGPS